MAVKRLSLPTPRFIFPAPDGEIGAADRAQLAVGYPLAAAAVAVAPTGYSLGRIRIPLVPVRAPVSYEDFLVTVFPTILAGEIDEVHVPSGKGALVIGVGILVAELEDELSAPPLIAELAGFSSVLQDCLGAVENIVGNGVGLESPPVYDELKVGPTRRLLVETCYRILGL
jgi:hypothetical protein